MRRENPEADDYWDANWLVTSIELVVGEIRARVTAHLRSDDLRAFREDLEQLDWLAKREARLESLEGWLTLRIMATATGLAVEGELVDQPGIGNRVSFTIGSDLALADITPTIRALRAIETRFPIVGNP